MPFKKVDPEILQASHALIVTETGKILLQKKTKDAPSNPGKLTLFGGRVEIGENETITLERELREELAIDIAGYRYEKLGMYQKTTELDGLDTLVHVYVVYGIDPKDTVLMEGESIIVDTAESVLHNPEITRITRLVLNDFLRLK